MVSFTGKHWETGSKATGKIGRRFENRNQRGKSGSAACGCAPKKTLVCSVFNMIMPVLAIAVLLGTIAYWNQMAYGLSLECEGENIGVLEDEAVF